MPGQQMVIADTVCVFCGHILTDSTRSDYDSNVCVSCVDTHFVWCESCDDVGYNDFSRPTTIPGIDPGLAHRYRWMISLNYMSDSGEWRCSECLHYCEVCNSAHSWEDNAWNCCQNERYLHDYGYRPMLKFWNTLTHWSHDPVTGVLYMGMEIETERASDLLQEWFVAAGEEYGAEKFIYPKSDGSLSDRGVEFVTHPATLEAIRNKFPWESFEYLQHNGARAWAMSACGMHIHVSRTAFTPTHLWKFIKFQALNSHRCIRFAGRESQQWASWSNDTMQELGYNETAKVVKQGRPEQYNRYCAINMLPQNTIELRYFRPNLLKPGVLRVVEFVDAMYNYTKQMTVPDVIMRNALRDWNSFLDWMSQQPQYENASTYIKEGII